MSDFITRWKRTHCCGRLTADDAGNEVVLMGWVHRRRDHGGVIFVDLRDREGIAQVVFNPEVQADAHREAHRIRSEFVLAVKGTVRRRPEGMANPDLPTGSVEVMVNTLEILSEAKTPPFVLDAETEISESIRLKYRYLDLRRPELQRNIILRSRVAAAAREYFISRGFLEIETPMLAKSTPEGARDYLVPSRVNPGTFYALPQSPQTFKQLLMISGFDRYFQIVRCFRDEDLRADRQPEFTQIDVEMSFITPEDIYPVMEGLIQTLYRDLLAVDVPAPFPRMTYADALERFGSDRPDIRFGMELRDLGDIARESEFKVFQSVLENGGKISGLCVPGGAAFSRKEIDDLGSEAAIFGAKGLAWMKVSESGLESSIAKFFSPALQARLIERFAARPGDLLLFVADDPKVVYASLGSLRLKIAARLNLYDPNENKFLWVVDFPMFEKGDDGLPTPCHHPFTSPHPDDLPYLESDPFRVRSLAYDMVLNGIEIGGGSIRIHSQELQSRVFRLLGIDEAHAREKFGFLLDALRFGPPPHGGIAFGFDRLIMLMRREPNIREVMAFPKNNRAQAVMEGAPSAVEEAQLKELGLRIRG